MNVIVALISQLPLVRALYFFVDLIINLKILKMIVIDLILYLYHLIVPVIVHGMILGQLFLAVGGL